MQYRAVTTRGMRTSTVTVVLFCAALAACSSGVSMTGPLETGSPGSQCQPATQGVAQTYGLESFRNAGATPAVITGVSLSNAHGVTLNQAVVFQIGDASGGTLIGGHSTFPPPPNEMPAGVLWSQATPAVGATVPPRSTAVTNLVASLTMTDPARGSADGLDVAYRVGDQDYVRRGTTAVILHAGGCR